jgi:hypothetical protein
MDETSGGIVAEESAGADSPPASTPETFEQALESAERTPNSQPGSDATPPEREPFIPRARFDEVNQRMQAAERQYQDVQQRYGRVLTQDPQALERALWVYQQLAADPVAGATQLLQELHGHPQFGPRVASEAARILASMRGQQPDDEEPQPNLRAEDGSMVFSADQQRKWYAWQDRQREAALSQRLAPFEQALQQQQYAAMEQQAYSGAKEQLEYMRNNWHGFREHEADVKAVMEQSELSPQDAYLYVLHTKILPGSQAKTQAQVMANLQAKAGAQTVNPGGGGGGKTPDFGGDFKKALEHFGRSSR